MALEKEMWPNRAAALANQEKGLAGATLSKIDLNLAQRQVRIYLDPCFGFGNASAAS